MENAVDRSEYGKPAVFRIDLVAVTKSRCSFILVAPPVQILLPKYICRSGRRKITVGTCTAI